MSSKCRTFLYHVGFWVGMIATMIMAVPPEARGAELLELRVICESPEVEALRNRPDGWKNSPANGWYASREVRKGIPGFRYAAGLGHKATIEILGVNSEVPDGQVFKVLTHRNLPTGRTVVGEKIPGGLRFTAVDMGEAGAISITLGPILDKSKDWVIRIHPMGWTGIGRTWKGTHFEGNYNYRKDKETVLPEMYTRCS